MDKIVVAVIAERSSIDAFRNALASRDEIVVREPLVSLETINEISPLIGVDVLVVSAQDVSEDVRGLIFAIKERHPDIKVVLCTASRNVDALSEALLAGAEGYCLTPCPAERLADAISAVHAGSIWVDTEFCSQLLQQSSTAPDAVAAEGVPKLSDREDKILHLIDKGCSTDDIARELGMSWHATRGAIRRMFEKLGDDQS